METIGLTINAITPPADVCASFAKAFREIAEKFNAISTDVSEDGLNTVYKAHFAGTDAGAKDAAEFAAFFYKTAGLECQFQRPPIIN